MILFISVFFNIYFACLLVWKEEEIRGWKEVSKHYQKFGREVFKKVTKIHKELKKK